MNDQKGIRLEAQLTPCKCAVCEKCRYDHANHMCIFGGPYAGYTEPKAR
jgi:hypothetical protein